jgi:4'-phosphopantetheinyl transferase
MPAFPETQTPSESSVDGLCDVTLVRLSLSIDDDDRASLEAVLAPEERERIGRRVPVVRRRAVASRGRLRLLLGRLLDVAPAAVALCQGPHGKPALTGPHAGLLEFNVSHSGEEGLIAVTRQGAVGVDLEFPKPTQDLAWARLMAGTIFSPAELTRWESLGENRSIAAILDAWVAKEAIFKAAGTGIGDRFRQVVLPENIPRIRLDLDGGATPCQLAAVESLPGLDLSQWAQGLTFLATGVGGHVALAYAGLTCRLTCRSFEHVLLTGLV